MLNKERAGDIFDRVRKYSTADEVEVLFYGGKSALTRFANNTIHQNVAEENYGVSVRTVFFFQAEDGIRDVAVTGVQTCALPIYRDAAGAKLAARSRVPAY